MVSTHLKNISQILACWASKRKKVNSFFCISRLRTLYMCPSSFSIAHNFFSHALDGKMSSILNLAMEHFVTHTHTSHVWSLLLFKVANTSPSSNFFWPSITLCLQASVRHRSIGFQPALILQSGSNERFPAWIHPCHSPKTKMINGIMLVVFPFPLAQVSLWRCNLETTDWIVVPGAWVPNPPNADFCTPVAFWGLGLERLKLFCASQGINISW